MSFFKKGHVFIRFFYLIKLSFGVANVTRLKFGVGQVTRLRKCFDDAEGQRLVERAAFCLYVTMCEIRGCLEMCN